MRTTGPILAVGAIALGNETIVANQPIDWRIPVGTGIAAAGFALFEELWEEGAVALAWLSLVTVLFVRINANTPSPVEAFFAWRKQ